jgi:hypothetical protein
MSERWAAVIRAQNNLFCAHQRRRPQAPVVAQIGGSARALPESCPSLSVTM